MCYNLEDIVFHLSNHLYLVVEQSSHFGCSFYLCAGKRGYTIRHFPRLVGENSIVPDFPPEVGEIISWLEFSTRCGRNIVSGTFYLILLELSSNLVHFLHKLLDIVLEKLRCDFIQLRQLSHNSVYIFQFVLTFRFIFFVVFFKSVL